MKKTLRIGVISLVAVVFCTIILAIPLSSAETVGNSWIRFNRDGVSTNQITLVQGRGEPMVLRHPSDRVLNRLRVSKEDGSEIPVSSPDWPFEINESNHTLNALIKPGDAFDDRSYTIIGDYYTMRAVGNGALDYQYVNEDGTPVYDGGSLKRTTIGVTVTSDANANGATNLIKEDSRATIEVTGVSVSPASGGLGYPNFAFKAGATRTGEFLNFDDVYIGGVELDATGRFVYYLNFLKGSNVLIIKVVSGFEFTKGSSLSINFVTDKSDPVTVKVKSSRQLVKEVKDALEKPEQRDPYITFANYNEIDYITTDFRLYHTVKVYGVEVTLDWDWIDQNPATPICVVPVDVFSQNYLTAKVTRLSGDVTGKLKADISYQPKGSTETPPAPVTTTLAATIKGLGTQPSTVYVPNVVHTDPAPVETEPSTEDPSTITSTITMDLNDGSVTRKSTGSQNPLWLRLQYGFGGGRAEYAVVTVAKSNMLAVYHTGRTMGSFQDQYRWGDKLLNTDYTTEGIKDLKIIPLAEGTTSINVKYYATPQSGDVLMDERNYNIKVVDTSPSTDSTLKSLVMIEVDADNKSETNETLVFSPAKTDYTVSVGNWVHAIKFRATKNDTKASSDIYVVLNDVTQADSMRSTVTSAAYPINTEEDNIYIFELIVTAEDTSTTTYRIYVERLDKSDDTSLKSLSIKDDKGVSYPYYQLANPQNKNFDGRVHEYGIELPYNVKRVVVDAQKNHTKAVVVIDPEPQPTINPFDPNRYVNFEEQVLVPPPITITITAEDGSVGQGYVLRVRRLPPSNDATLESLVVKDHTTKEINLNFDKYIENYETVQVDNSVRFVTIYPVPLSKYATVTLNEETELIDPVRGKVINLAVNTTVTIKVHVTAEDGLTQKTYTLSLLRLPPSSDATLANLTVGALKLSPIFSPLQIDYTAIANETTTSVTVTATASQRGATIKVNSIPVLSGSASAAIPLNDETTVTVVVTAENGTTTKTYTVIITNDDLRVKGTNADLESLKVNEGDMSPGFKSSITTYNVPVDGDVEFIDIFPIPADERATVAIKSGSKYIGDSDGNFSEALKNGNNKFTIEVTADDGKTKKAYTLTVNRSTGGSAGSINPISTDQIDFRKSKTIYVDITKYTVISSKIFTELAKYPDTVIIFQGNDYSISFKGSDISKIIPFAQAYNLSMSFTSPNETTIRGMVGVQDVDAAMIFLYFKHHGVLPAPGTLTVDLGTKYKNQTLYLHYYNPAMKRIEYYGTVKANNRGTVAFKVDHFSDYILTFKRLSNSVDKSSEVNIGVSDADKINPDTGR